MKGSSCWSRAAGLSTLVFTEFGNQPMTKSVRRQSGAQKRAASGPLWSVSVSHLGGKCPDIMLIQQVAERTDLHLEQICCLCLIARGLS